MPENIFEILEQVKQEAANTPALEAETPPATDPTQETPPEGGPAVPSDAPGATGEPNPNPEYDVEDFVFEKFKQEHPEAARNYEAALTKMRQRDKQKVAEAQERLKAYDGVSELDARSTRQLNEILANDPIRGAQILEDIARRARQSRGEAPAQPPPADPLANFAPQTDNEVALMEVVRGLNSQLQQVAPTVNSIQEQLQQAQQQQAIQRDFALLEAATKTAIPAAERQKLYDFAVQNRLPSLEMAYKVMAFETRAAQAADTAALTRKLQSSPVPTNTLGRGAETPPPPPKGIHDIFRQEKEKVGSRG